MSANDEEGNGLTRRGLVGGLSVGAAALIGGQGQEALAATARNKGRWDREADVVILGYGGAGACAAIAAHDAGAKVLVIEKQAEATHFPDTRMAAGALQCPDRDGDPKALKEYSKAMFSGENLPWMLESDQPPGLADALADVWTQHSVETIDFLRSLDPDIKFIKASGPAFTNFPGARDSHYRMYFVTYTGKADTEIATKDLPKNQKMNGEAFSACLAEGLRTRRIVVQYETRATRLLSNEDDAVIGVLAEEKGKTIRIRANRGVIIATGGYEYGLELRRAFLEGQGGEGWAFYGCPASTGDGIEMALRLGAGLVKAGKTAGRVVGAVPLRANGVKMGIPTDSLGSPNSIVIDSYGDRYANELLILSDPSRYFFYKQALAFDITKLVYARNPSWMIFDETLRARRSIAAQGYGTTGYGLVPWAPDNQDAIERGWILKGDTIAELAAKISAHPDNRKLMNADRLAKAIARYNEFCAKGTDGDFGRHITADGTINKPPYYALPLYAGGPSTKGGISADAERRVLDWKGKPVARLFAAGEIASIFKFVEQSGANLAECIVMGRIAGKGAASERPWI
jgi:3-oxosteroid 1-dehydrogenase